MSWESGVEASDRELEVISSVADYLEDNYMRSFDQDPLWITGSAVNGSEPSDYDLVLQRSMEGSDFSDRQDYEVVASMMRDLTTDEEFMDYTRDEAIDSVDSRMRKSSYVDISNSANLRPDPVHRFEMDIKNVPIDLSFSPERPEDYALKIR